MEEFKLVDRGRHVVAAALHAGHELRTSLLPWCALDPAVRMREEDPYTDVIADVGTSLLVAERSRFEVDLNRPRSAAVYRTPAEAWGLDLWRGPLPEVEIERSLDLYDRFYRAAGDLLDRAVATHGGAVIFDVHSYNHRRGGPRAPANDAAAEPEINLGTGTLDTARWAPLVERVIAHLAAGGFDVRENVKFRGGHFSAWAHERYEGQVAVLALEFKKTFMDEWTGAVDLNHLMRLQGALAACVALVQDPSGMPR